MNVFETVTSETGDEYISHSLLTDEFVDARTYQIELAEQALAESSLVALPTGTGKTIVSLLVTAERLKQTRETTVFLAPTKPLVEQQYEFYVEALDISESEMLLLTSDTHSPAEREDVWAEKPSVIFATPQIVENDIVSERANLAEISYVTFDECHRASGDYAYTYIAEKYWMDSENPLVTGLSASPGSDEDDILQVCKNLGITNVEVRTEDDSGLSEYVHTVETDVKKIEMDDEILEMREYIQDRFTTVLSEVKEMGYINTAAKNTSNGKLRKAQGEISAAMKKGESDAYKAMSLIAEAMKIQQSLRVLDSQGVSPFLSYIQTVREDAQDSDGSKASARMISNNNIQKAISIGESYNKLHPKKSVLQALAIEKIASGGQVLIFTEYRDTAEDLTKFFNDFDKINAHKFVGQQNKTNSSGMTQKQQKQTISEFSDGVYDILVATSIGEEGLDIPEVDLVVFFEPVSSPLRKIQRAGRTGRQTTGEVKILVGKGTIDETLYYIAKNKEDSMETDMKALADIQTDINTQLAENQTHLKEYGETKQQTEENTETESKAEVTLSDFEEQTPDEIDSQVSNNVTIDTDEDTTQIIFDSREQGSGVTKALSKKSNLSLSEEQLEVGDYIISDSTAVERKSIADFLDTITSGDRSVFEQIGDIISNYETGIILLEGENVNDLYTSRNIAPNAIRGLLSSLAIDYGVSIIHTVDESDTADMLVQMAKREQTDTDSEVNAHGSKKGKTLIEQQEYIVSSFKSIGPVTAQNLLKEFGSVHDIITAEKSELKSVKNIGEKTADAIYNIVRAEYDFNSTE